MREVKRESGCMFATCDGELGQSLVGVGPDNGFTQIRHPSRVGVL